jgi:hypothetical protein
MTSDGPSKMARNASPLRGDNLGQDESLRVTRDNSGAKGAWSRNLQPASRVELTSALSVAALNGR